VWWHSLLEMGEETTLPDFVVIGAGLSRTGTLSTRAALEHLLGGPCYHGAVPMVERVEHAELWTEALEKGSLDVDTAKKLLGGYKAGVDHPIYCFYKDLLQMNPSSKVILTVRDPKSWYPSIDFMTTMVTTLACSLPYCWFLTLVGLGHQVGFIRSNIKQSLGINGRLGRALKSGEDEAIKFFNDHVAEVKAFVPPHQLLVFNVKEGWEPLCKFLDRPIPNIPFPHVNDRREVMIVFNTVRAVSWITLLGLPVLLYKILSYCINMMHLAGLIILGLFLLWGAGYYCHRVFKKQLRTEKMKMQ